MLKQNYSSKFFELIRQMENLKIQHSEIKNENLEDLLVDLDIRQCKVEGMEDILVDFDIFQCKVDDLKKQNDDLKKRNDYLTKTLENVRNERDLFQEQVEVMKKQDDYLIKTLENTRNERDTFQEQVEDLKKQNDYLTKTLEHAQNERDTFQEQVKDLEKDTSTSHKLDGPLLPMIIEEDEDVDLKERSLTREKKSIDKLDQELISYFNRYNPIKEKKKSNKLDKQLIHKKLLHKRKPRNICGLCKSNLNRCDCIFYAKNEKEGRKRRNDRIYKLRLEKF